MMPINPGKPGSDEPELMLEINTTPLIDVLLVLLVMFIITIPVQLHAVNMAVPPRAERSMTDVSEVIEIHIDAASRMLWNGTPVSPQELETRMTAVAQQAPPPLLQVRPDRASAYAAFAHVLAASRRQGLNRVTVVGTEQFR